MPAPPLEMLERLAEAADRTARGPAQRMLIIVNPYATTVSDRLKNLVVYALQGRYEVEAVDTTARDHATEICREAAHEGYDVVVAFGGDGTVNEAANGLAGSGTPLTCLPGGATNVYARILGIPSEIVDATEHLLSLADDWRPRQVDLGRVNGRCFTFASGVGLDASVVERVDAHPRLKARLGEWYYTYAAVATFNRRYLVGPPQLEIEVGSETLRGVTLVAQTARPYTYFGPRPIEVAEDVAVDDGLLGGAILQRARPVDIPSLLWRGISRRARMARHRRVHPFSGVQTALARSLDGRPVPLQVDGDHVGAVTEARYDVWPGGLTVVS